jgi:hypothetical protein
VLCLRDRVATLCHIRARTFLGRICKPRATRCVSNLQIVLVLALLLFVTAGVANAQYHSNSKVPPTEQLDAMVNDTIQAYNNALQQKDFKAFHSWVSTKTQQMFTVEKMLETSKPLTDRKVNLAVLKGRKPTYPREPEIVNEGGMSVLRVKAVFKIKETVTAKLQYVTEKQLWRLLTIDVSLE